MCWKVDDVLTEHLASLKAIFSGWADSKSPDALSNSLMSIDEWLDFCSSVELIDGEFTTREAVLAFVWCRMSVVDERLKSSRIKLVSLHLEVRTCADETFRVTTFPVFTTATYRKCSTFVRSTCTTHSHSRLASLPP